MLQAVVTTQLSIAMQQRQSMFMNRSHVSTHTDSTWTFANLYKAKDTKLVYSIKCMQFFLGCSEGLSSRTL